MSRLDQRTPEEQRQIAGARAVRDRLLKAKPRTHLALEPITPPAMQPAPIALRSPKPKGTIPAQQHDDHVTTWRSWMARRPYRMRNYVKQRARDYGYTMGEICSFRKTQTLVAARHQIMWEVWRKFDASLPMIGRLFNRHHTTVLHAVRKMNERERARAKAARIAYIHCPQCSGEGFNIGGLVCGICTGTGRISATEARQYATDYRDAAEQQGSGMLALAARQKLIAKATEIYRQLDEAVPMSAALSKEGDRDD